MFEMFEQRFGNPLRCGREAVAGDCKINELSTDDDAIGVIDHELASKRNGEVGLDPKVESESRCSDLDLVQRTVPGLDDEPRLFCHLAAQSIDELFAGIDHSPRCRPIGLAAPASILDQQNTAAGIDHHATGHHPLPQCMLLAFAFDLVAHLTQHSRSPAPLVLRTDAWPLPSSLMNGTGEFEANDDADEALDASAVEPLTTPDVEVLPYRDLVAPTPLRADPPVVARWLAFGSILLGGLLGALIGYGVLDLFTGSANWSALGALGFGVGGAVGLGVVTSLTLRAMNEWKEVQHPERPRAANRETHDDTDA